VMLDRCGPGASSRIDKFVLQLKSIEQLCPFSTNRKRQCGQKPTAQTGMDNSNLLPNNPGQDIFVLPWLL
jgi:hypothetical protein